MKLKSLLFGSAAALAAVTGARAADLPMPAPVAVDYVKVCSVFGAGYFYIPGSQTCIKIGGAAVGDFIASRSFDYSPTYYGGPGVVGAVNLNGRRVYDNFVSQARAILNIDTKTQTAVGLVHTYVEEWWTVSNYAPGINNGTTPFAFGTPFDPSPTSQYDVLFRAYAQLTNDFGTLTGGRNASYFDFYGRINFVDRFGHDDPTGPTNLLAYTFNFGKSGLSGTISLEDSSTNGGGNSWRRADGSQPGAPGGAGVGPTGAPSPLSDFRYAGQRYPDLVGNLNYTQAWGQLQVMGALHDVRSQFSTGVPGSLVVQNVPFTTATYTGVDQQKVGWAVGIGGKINIPNTGLQFLAQATYGRGATDYVTTNGQASAQPQISADAVVRPIYGPAVPGGPGFAIQTGDSNLALARAWSIRGGMIAQLSPAWTLVTSASYAHTNYAGSFICRAGVVPVGGPGAALPVCTGPNNLTSTGLVTTAPGGIRALSDDTTVYTATASIRWTPAPGVTIGPEIDYQHSSVQDTRYVHGNDWEGVFRVAKAF